MGRAVSYHVNALICKYVVRFACDVGRWCSGNKQGHFSRLMSLPVSGIITRIVGRLILCQCKCLTRQSVEITHLFITERRKFLPQTYSTISSSQSMHLFSPVPVAVPSTTASDPPANVHTTWTPPASSTPPRFPFPLPLFLLLLLPAHAGGAVVIPP